MNVIRMTGGLGNQMFQYALYLKFKSLNVDCKFEDFTEYVGKDNARPILLKKAFDIDYPVASMDEYKKLTDSYMDIFHRTKRKILGRKTKEYAEKSLEYDETLLDKKDAYLTGFFQSEKYFKDIESIIKKEFSFTESVKNEALKFLDGYEIDENTVSIHIRRGDYIDNEAMYGNICTDAYYKEAVELIKGKNKAARFIILSNDSNWCSEWAKRILPNDDVCIFDGTTEDNGYIDMYIMSICAHNIIANSSFSWWGAYLNSNKDKMVIAPSKWDNINNRKDIFFDGMTLI